MTAKNDSTKQYKMSGVYRYLENDKIEMRISSDNLTDYKEFADDNDDDTLFLIRQK